MDGKENMWITVICCNGWRKWRMESVIEQIRKTGIIPVVVIDDVKDAVPLAKALIDGGLSCAEVTFRTEAAADALKEMSAAYPKLLLGAGTVLTTEQVDKAVESGAELITAGD